MALHYYDHGLTELFRHPSFIRSLVTEIIAEPWVKLLDLNSMRVEDGVHKEIAEPSRFSDLVISFSCTSQSEYEGFSIYLLIEFQSSREPMSLRLLEYLSRVYRRQVKTGTSRYGPLHPVVPIVIYNGEAPWKENTAFLSRFLRLPPSLKPYIPDFRYFLLDEGRFNPQLLSRLKGASAAFIKLDTIDKPEKTEEAARKIISILKQLWKREPEAAKLLSKYVEGLLAHRGIDNPAVSEYINNRRRPMFAQRLDRALDNKWKEGLKQGIEKGIAEGKREGVREGTIREKQTVLLRLLSRKFELVPPDKELVTACENPEKLDAALDVILFAAEKDAVLKELRQE